MCPAPAGNYPEFHFWLSKLCILGGNSNGASHRRFATAAKCEAIDRGNNGLAKAFNQVENVLTISARLLGLNRGRYYLLTGQTLDAAKALEYGLVAEVLPPGALMARAWELAAVLATKPLLTLRYTRLLLTEYLRRQMHDLLGYGLGMEMLALIEKPEAPGS